MEIDAISYVCSISKAFCHNHKTAELYVPTPEELMGLYFGNKSFNRHFTFKVGFQVFC